MFDVVNNAHDVLYSKTSYDAPFVTVRYIAVGSHSLSEFEYLHTPDHSEDNIITVPALVYSGSFTMYIKYLV